MGRWRDFPCLNEPSVLDTDRRQEQSPGRREGPRGLVWPQSTAALPPASQCSESHACRLPSTRLLLLSLVPDSRSSNCTLATNNFHCLKYALGKNGHQFHLWKATNSWYKVVSPKLHEYTWAKQHEAEQVYTNRCYSVIHIILWDVLLLWPVTTHSCSPECWPRAPTTAGACTQDRCFSRGPTPHSQIPM